MSDFWLKHWQWIVFGAFALLGNVMPVWRWWRRRAAQSWPLAQGRIEGVDVPAERKIFGLPITNSSNRQQMAQITYSYLVGGENFHGLYERGFGRAEEAWDFLRDLQGKPIEVHYDRSNPRSSALAEESLEALDRARPPAPPSPTREIPSWLRSLLLPFALMAFIGLVLSLWVHLGAIAGHAPDSYFMALHVGIFIVFLPAILVAQKRVGFTGRRDFWNLVLKGSPEWMKYLLYGFFGYVFVNFFWCLTKVPGGHNVGPMTAIQWRLFSGHWMVFYFASFAILYTAVTQPTNSAVSVDAGPTGNHCANGHRIGKWESFCAVCGGPRAY